MNLLVDKIYAAVSDVGEVEFCGAGKDFLDDVVIEVQLCRVDEQEQCVHRLLGEFAQIYCHQLCHRVRLELVAQQFTVRSHCNLGEQQKKISAHKFVQNLIRMKATLASDDINISNRVLLVLTQNSRQF